MLSFPLEEVICKGPPCVLDVALSLAPAGLFWTLGLARAVPVWLPQFHWAVVDDHNFLADERLVTALAGRPDYAEACATFVRVRDEWRQARDDLGLESMPGLFWPGDGRGESVVPKDNDRTVVDRFHVLAAGLDARRSRSASPENSTNTLADSARDVLALAVALGDRRAIVLTPLGAGRAAPTLVDHLAAAGIACRELTERVLMEPLRNALVPALLASGLAVPLASDRFRLAALSVVAPGALGAAALATDIISGGDDDLSLEAAADQGEAVLWDDAAAIWWELP